MTTSKTRSATVAYLLECIDGTGYGVITVTDDQKWQFISETFQAEYGWQISDQGMAGRLAIREWLLGLPSAISVDFTYCDIHKRLELLGVITGGESEKKLDKLYDQYWSHLASAIYAECRKAGYPVDCY